MPRGPGSRDSRAYESGRHVLRVTDAMLSFLVETYRALYQLYHVCLCVTYMTLLRLRLIPSILGKYGRHKKSSKGIKRQSRGADRGQLLPPSPSALVAAPNDLTEAEDSLSTAEPEQYVNTAESTEDGPQVDPVSDRPVEGTRARDHDSVLDDDCDAEDSVLSVERGRGVCVVRAAGRDDGGQRFELDEAALAALLRARLLADRPLVLVSVAGAFRGGKSFLLDFLLRYLYAGESARADGSWLGAPDEPLRGFSWRGGCARETQGLVLWSQPFPVTLPDGSKVVVLLMDTQGSFDDQSSFRDCSLIFALSTLLSSVQVYNLSQRINESDLQHLQVFTEFAAAGGGALPALQLLVRDWSAPGDFAFGAAGGARYLRHKLQVREEQPRELREVRERLTSSFERVACCLLPHPGLAAAVDPAFQGLLADLREDFKSSLREFVPLLLAPARLRVKTVDGRVLRARDVAVHLRAYLDTFRHHVPSPQSIVRALATARWLTAAADARGRLRTAAPAVAAPARGRAALRARLAAERRAALEPLVELAARTEDGAALADLEKELDEQVAQYININEGKIASGVAEAKEEWERQTHAMRDPALCAPERDLCEDAAAARAAAVARYDHRVADPEEPDRAQLIQELEERGTEVAAAACGASARNHAAAARAALAALRAALPRACLPPAALAAAHAAAAEHARADLRAARTRPARHDPDPHLENLDERISVILREHEAQNVAANERAVSAARQEYDAAMALSGRCRHPADLAATHERALAGATDELRRRRSVARATDGTDVFGEQLETIILDRYAEYMRMNTRNNSVAVEEAYGAFCARMDSCGVLQLSAAEFVATIAAADVAAKRAFRDKRLSEIQLGIDDIYYTTLEQKIRDRCEYYREKNGKKLTMVELAGALAAAGVAAATGAAAAVAVPGLFGALLSLLRFPR